MVEVGKIGGETLVLDGRYISIFKEGKLVWKRAYIGYYLPDGNLYLYRRRVRITEQSGNTLKYYQIRIEIGAGDPIWKHARSAGEDIRFCYHPEEEMLSYWIEKYDPDAEEAVIWVKVPEIPANSEIEIYMYYGNPDVASASDGDAVFEFFDDFEGTSLDTEKWGEFREYGAEETGSWATIGDFSIEIDNKLRIYGTASTSRPQEGNYWLGKAIRSVKTFTHPLIIEFDITPVTVDSSGLFLSGLDLEYDDENRFEGYLVDGYYGYKYGLVAEENGTRGGGVSSDPNIWEVGKRYKVKYVYDASATLTVYLDGVERVSRSWAGTGTNFHITLFGANRYKGYPLEVHFHLVFVRKYASPEPFVSIGAEE